MAHMRRMLTPESSPEPETRPSGLWQPKPTSATNSSSSGATTNAAATQQQQQQSSSSPQQQKRKRSWPFTTTRPVSPPSSTSPVMRDDDDDNNDDERPGIKAMWESNTARSGVLSRAAASRGRAPFQDADLEADVQPIFEALIQAGVDVAASPEYALAFYPRAHELALHAENALLHHGDRAQARRLYLRACALLRVGRFCPVAHAPPPPSSPPCPIRARAWHLQKSYHTKAGRLMEESPLDEVLIPHTHDAATKPNESTAGGVRERGSISAAAKTTTRAGPARPQIPAVVRLPRQTLRKGTPCPAVLVVTGDRTAHSRLCGDLLARGVGCVVVEAPGCGDCPVAAGEGEGDGAALLWASVLDWMAAIRVFDMARVAVWADAGGSRALDHALVGRFAGGGGSPRVRGCVAFVSGGGDGGGDGWAASDGRVLVVADNDDDDDDDDGLVLSEYGGAGRAVRRSVAAGSAAVYDWVEDLLSPSLVV